MAKEVTFTHDEIRGILMAQGLLLPEETLTIGPKSVPTADPRPALFLARDLQPGEAGCDAQDGIWAVKRANGVLAWFDPLGDRCTSYASWGGRQVCEGRNPPKQVAAFAAQEAGRA